MRISLIAAMDQHRLIGANNGLPWHLPADMKYFKEKTIGHHILTGRKNYESIPEKYRPLPGRVNLIVTRQRNCEYPGARCFHSINEAIEQARSHGEKELFVIGGGELFTQMMSRADKMYLTFIHYTFRGDVYFPEIDRSEWKMISKTDCYADEKNAYDYSFTEWEKVSEN
ncbi:MAG: dihydrofolate reductase [Bacteroidetes bacterium]|jgi:dihydrofolate reductase|nr:dihydrofolate reductase [Bacteroidota bacterium]